MLISEVCIKKPVFATVLSLVLVVLGAIFFTKLQIRGIPDISPPVISIAANYDGADGLYMEKQITTRLEKVLKTVKNLDFMTSTSSKGSSSITLVFTLNADIEVALSDVRSKISDLSYIFPQDMKMPSITKADSDAFPSLWLSVNSDVFDSLELTKIVRDNISTALEKLTTVGRAVIYGGRDYSIIIEPDPVKLYQYKISPVEIETAVRKQNQDYPAGSIKTESRDFTISLIGSLSTKEEFENIIIRSDGGYNLKLKDIAKVSLKAPDEEVLLRYNGKKAMAIGLVKDSKANIIDLSRQATQELEKIRKIVPSGVRIDVAFDGATSVNASIKSVFGTIFEALVLVVLVTYLFLASFKITIIPFVTIPVSLVGTFSMMYFMGFSVNTFTLLAMILAIGLVVDDAIVMLENVFRHNEMGKTPLEAAFAAVKEIGFTIVAMTITLAAVFLPVGFIEGFLGKLFIEFAWTLAFCVLFSGFVALTLTPMMASKMVYIDHEAHKPKFLQKFDYYLCQLQENYLKYLNITLNHKKQFFSFVALSVVVLIVSFIFVDKAFVPEEDAGYLQVVFSGPEGSSLEQSEAVVKEAEQILGSYTDILGYFEVVGWGGSDSAFAFVPLKDWSIRKKSQSQLQMELNQKFFSIPGMSIFAIAPRSLASGNSQHPIEFNLQTSLEYDEIDKLSANFINEMKKISVFQNVDRDFKSSTPTFDVIVNRDKAYRYGVSLESIGNTLNYLIAGRQIGDFRMGNEIYDVTLRYNEENRNKADAVRKIFVPSKTEMIPLEVVVEVVEKITPKSYSHYNNSKAIAISSDLAPGHKITEAIDEINKVAKRLLDTSTTKLEYLGEIQRMQESQGNLATTFLFALIFIYLVLAAQFESFTDPLLILMAVPFSMTGGVLALWIFGNSINMYSNIGLITLIGLITKNSIMLVEFANQLNETGVSIRDSAIQAAKLRLRPILMTTLATICGAIPLVLAHGAGAQARSSIGLVIVGGMSLGTIFTLFVIPVLYQTFKRERA
jgi:HAE1 family hydrophobic/amphiphilic exporter-1